VSSTPNGPSCAPPPGTAWLLLAAVALTVAVSAATDAGASCRAGLVCQPDPVKLSLTGIDLGQLTYGRARASS
jgi:hypothetical protein